MSALQVVLGAVAVLAVIGLVVVAARRVELAHRRLRRYALLAALDRYSGGSTSAVTDRYLRAQAGLRPHALARVGWWLGELDLAAAERDGLAVVLHGSGDDRAWCITPEGRVWLDTPAPACTHTHPSSCPPPAPANGPEPSTAAASALDAAESGSERDHEQRKER